MSTAKAISEDGENEDEEEYGITPEQEERIKLMMRALIEKLLKNKTLIHKVLGDDDAIDPQKLGFGHISRRDLSEMLLRATWVEGIFESSDAREPISTQTAMEAFDILLAAGADINYRDSEVLSPLSAALNRENPEIIKHVLDKGVDVGPKYVESELLEELLDDSKMDLFKQLVEHGSVVNSSSESVIRSLILWIEEGNLEMVRFLADHGVDFGTTVKEESFGTGFYGSIDNKEKEINKLVSESGESSKVDLPKFVDSVSSSMEVVKLLLPLGFPVIPRNSVTEMANNGSFYTLSCVFAVLASAGKTVEFPAQHVDFGKGILASPVSLIGARTLTQLMRANPSRVKSADTFLGKLERIADADVASDSSRGPEREGLSMDELIVRMNQDVKKSGGPKSRGKVAEKTKASKTRKRLAKSRKGAAKPGTMAKNTKKPAKSTSKR